jgi:uncharacterized membrane protein YedE/YeeE
MKEILYEPWPWYVTGPLFGLTIPLLLIFGNKMLGVSSSMQHICTALLPSKANYFKYNWKDGIWNILVALGIVLGGLFCRLFLQNPDPVAISESTKADLADLGITDLTGYMPVEILSNEQIFTLNGLLFMVLGGFLVGFGVRYAGGCTSGHGFMGLSILSISSIVAVVAFFAGGLIMTHFLFPFIFNFAL